MDTNPSTDIIEMAKLTPPQGRTIAFSPQGELSSTIASWGYDPRTRLLDIGFVGSGALYRYVDVPPQVAHGLASETVSLGRYVDLNIKRAGYVYLRWTGDTWIQPIPKK